MILKDCFFSLIAFQLIYDLIETYFSLSTPIHSPTEGVIMCSYSFDLRFQVNRLWFFLVCLLLLGSGCAADEYSSDSAGAYYDEDQASPISNIPNAMSDMTSYEDIEVGSPPPEMSLDMGRNVECEEGEGEECEPEAGCEDENCGDEKQCDPELTLSYPDPVSFEQIEICLEEQFLADNATVAEMSDPSNPPQEAGETLPLPDRLCEYRSDLLEWCKDRDGDCYVSECDEAVTLPRRWVDCDDRRASIGGANAQGECVNSVNNPDSSCRDEACSLTLDVSDLNLQTEETQIILASPCTTVSSDDSPLKVVLISQHSVEQRSLYNLHVVYLTSNLNQLSSSQRDEIQSYPLVPGIIPTWIQCQERSIYVADQINSSVYKWQSRREQLELLYPSEIDQPHPDDQLLHLNIDQNQLIWMVRHSIDQEIRVYQEENSTIFRFPLFDQLSQWFVNAGGWGWMMENYFLYLPLEQIDDEEKMFIEAVGTETEGVRELIGSSDTVAWMDEFGQLNILPWIFYDQEDSSPTPAPLALTFNLSSESTNLHQINQEWIWLDQQGDFLFFNYLTQQVRDLSLNQQMVSPDLGWLMNGWMVWANQSEPSRLFFQRL